MKTCRIITWLWLGSTLALLGPHVIQPANPKRPAVLGPVRMDQVKMALSQLPLSFEASVDLGGRAAGFFARGAGYAFSLDPAGAIMEVGVPGSAAGARLSMTLEGGNPSPALTGEQRLAGVSHYFIGSDPSRWRTDVPQYAAVRVVDAYPGIDLVYYGNRRELEFDLVVEPGRDPSRIVLAFDGARKLEIDGRGDLLADLGNESVRLRRPDIYQGSGDRQERVEGSFALLGPTRVGFEVSPYDHGRALVIDPAFVYSTYFGSGDYDLVSKVAVDSAGYLYVQGSTSSTRFPTTSALTATAPGGLFDVFVTKLTPAGDKLVFSTYFGGSGRDTADGMVLDADGDIYLTGETTSTNFPLAGALQSTFGGTGSVGFGDAFMTKLKGDGSAITYSTFIGGSRDDMAMGIAVDAQENAYITGVTESTDFPVASAFQATFGGGPRDAFVSKVKADGSAFVYSTYLGGSGDETSIGFGNGDIALTTDGAACIVGFTTSANFPLANAYQSAYKGGAGLANLGDAFVTKFHPSGSSLVFSTFLGGTKNDLASSVATDKGGNVYVGGKTQSSDFPLKNAYQASHGGDQDVFVSAFSADGTSLLQSTYIGGSGADALSDIAVDGSANVYLVGTTASPNFPTVSPIQSSMSGSGDGFVSVLAAGGSSLAFSTFLGGTGSASGGAGSDSVASVRLDSSGNLYVAGAASPGFPTANAMTPNPPGSSGGLFLAKVEAIRSVAGPTITSLLPSDARAGDARFTLVVSGSDFVNGAVVLWDQSARSTTFVSRSRLETVIAVEDVQAGRTVMVTVRNPDGGVSNALAFAIHNPSPTLTSISPTRMTGGGDTFTLTVTGARFVPNSVVQWNESARTTTYVSGTELRASIAASDIATAGDVRVTVFNPAPAGGSSGAILLPVSGFTIDPSPSSATVTAGQPATYTIQVVPQHGSFDSAVSFTCTGVLPDKTTASFSPASTTPGSAAVTTKLTVGTTAQGAGAGPIPGGTGFASPALALSLLAVALWLCVLLGKSVPGWSLRGWLSAGAMVGLATLFVCCGGGGGGGGPGGGTTPPASSGTPKGTYQITVQGASGLLKATTTITLTVN